MVYNVLVGLRKRSFAEVMNAIEGYSLFLSKE